MKKILFSIAIVAAIATMVSCDGKTAKDGDNDSTATSVQEENAKDADGQEEADLTEGSDLEEPQEEVQDLTFADVAGIYDDENQESRFCLNEDGTATWGMIGSLHYTEYSYTIDGNTICLRPVDVESEDDCYDYDEDTRTLKNEQGAVYYREE